VNSQEDLVVGVTGLTDEITDTDVRRHFSKFGIVDHVKRISPDRA
jgi:hypothetical protein